MNTHVKITDPAPTDLSRRSFLVGSAATGLVLGYPPFPASARSGLGRAFEFRSQRLVFDRARRSSSR